MRGGMEGCIPPTLHCSHQHSSQALAIGVNNVQYGHPLPVSTSHSVAGRLVLVEGGWAGVAVAMPVPPSCPTPAPDSVLHGAAASVCLHHHAHRLPTSHHGQGPAPSLPHDSVLAAGPPALQRTADRLAQLLAYLRAAWPGSTLVQLTLLPTTEADVGPANEAFREVAEQQVGAGKQAPLACAVHLIGSCGARRCCLCGQGAAGGVGGWAGRQAAGEGVGAAPVGACLGTPLFGHCREKPRVHSWTRRLPPPRPRCRGWLGPPAAASWTL